MFESVHEDKVVFTICTKLSTQMFYKYKLKYTLQVSCFCPKLQRDALRSNFCSTDSNRFYLFFIIISILAMNKLNVCCPYCLTHKAVLFPPNYEKNKFDWMCTYKCSNLGCMQHWWVCKEHPITTRTKRLRYLTSNIHIRHHQYHYHSTTNLLRSMVTENHDLHKTF